LDGDGRLVRVVSLVPSRRTGRTSSYIAESARVTFLTIALVVTNADTKLAATFAALARNAVKPFSAVSGVVFR